MIKNLPLQICYAGDLGLIPGSGRSPGGGNGYPLQHSCLENSMVTLLHSWRIELPRGVFWGKRECVCLVAQLCPTPCNPMDYSLPDSSVHGILQARILEWVALPSSRRSSQPREWTQVSCIAGGFFTIWATREAQVKCDGYGDVDILCIYSVLHNFVL